MECKGCCFFRSREEGCAGPAIADAHAHQLAAKDALIAQLRLDLKRVQFDAQCWMTSANVGQRELKASQERVSLLLDRLATISTLATQVHGPVSPDRLKL